MIINRQIIFSCLAFNKYVTNLTDGHKITTQIKISLIFFFKLFNFRSISSASQFVDASRLSLADLSTAANMAHPATVPYGLGFHGSSYQLQQVNYGQRQPAGVTEWLALARVLGVLDADCSLLPHIVEN